MRAAASAETRATSKEGVAGAGTVSGQDGWQRIVEALLGDRSESYVAFSLHNNTHQAARESEPNEGGRPATRDDEEDFDKVTGTYLVITDTQGFPATQKQVADALDYDQSSVRRIARRVGIRVWPPC